MRRKWIETGIFCALSLCLGAGGCARFQAEKKNRPVAFVVAQNGRLSAWTDAEMRNILSAPEIGYVYCQHGLDKNGVDARSREYAGQLAAAGKRFVLQIWWGPAGDFPWSKYSFPNIALDKGIREEFFKEVVDRAIKGYGVQNIYGVNLLEEIGGQFGVDVEDRDDPEDFTHFKDSGYCYGERRPYWSGSSLADGAKYGKWDIPNVRRHEKDFKKITGIGFKDSNVAEGLRTFIFDRWVSQRLQSLAEIEFAKYIHANYPGIKVFTFAMPNYEPGQNRTDLGLVSKHVDGIICDPYSRPALNFHVQRFLRAVAPAKEIINFSWGGRAGEALFGDATAENLGIDAKINRCAGAYLAGMDVLGLWTEVPGRGCRSGKIWDDYRFLAKTMSQLPRFEKRSKVLLITGDAQDIYGSHYALTGLKYYDVCPLWEAYHFNLEDYEMVILYDVHHFQLDTLDKDLWWNSDSFKKRYGVEGYLDFRRFNAFVRGGGVLFLCGNIPINADSPLFIAKEGYLHTESNKQPAVLDLKIEPAGWWADKLGLTKNYRFSGYRMLRCIPGNAAVMDGPAGCFFEYGKGCVYFVPLMRNYDPAEDVNSEQWKQYRQFLVDVMRQTLLLKGKRNIADECLALPGTANNYLDARDDRQRIRGVVQDFTLGLLTEMQVKGKDVFNGDQDPTVNDKRTGVIVRW